MEAKNSYFKRIAQLGNFRNIVYSVAKRHQRLMCSYLQSHNFFSTTTECGPGILLIKQLSVDVHIFTELSVYSCQARRQGGFKGVRLNPCKRFYTHRLTVHFEYPTIWNWSSSLNWESPLSKQVCSWRTSAERVHVSCLRRCDERIRANKLLLIFRALESSPVVFLYVGWYHYSDITPPAVLPTLIPFLLEIWSQP